jgi:hypothetical protein
MEGKNFKIGIEITASKEGRYCGPCRLCFNARVFPEMPTPDHYGSFMVRSNSCKEAEKEYGRRNP